MVRESKVDRPQTRPASVRPHSRHSRHGSARPAYGLGLTSPKPVERDHCAVTPRQSNACTTPGSDLNHPNGPALDRCDHLRWPEPVANAANLPRVAVKIGETIGGIRQAS